VSLNSSFKDLLSVLNRCEAKYLVVGGYAVMLYTEPRYTKDLDLWIESTPDNAQRVFRALAEFGAPLAGMNPEDFTQPDVIYQLGMPPSRIDVLTSITGVEFADAWRRKTDASFGDVPANFIHAVDLIQNKRATARPSDLVDCARLEEARKFRPDPE
jgi:hypothetical protein